MQMLLWSILGLGLLITFHEFGHFIVARWCGVKVLSFSVGFGPVLLRWQDKKQTEFRLSLIPLGGYVTMLEASNNPKLARDLPNQVFNNKKLIQRVLIVAAGPFANFLLAVLLSSVILISGVERVVPLIGDVIKGSPAEQAGMRPHEIIGFVDDVKVSSWGDVSLQLVKRAGDSGVLKIVTTNNLSQHSYFINLSNFLSTSSEQSILGVLGLEPFRPVIVPIINNVQKGSAAAKAGLRKADRIIEVNNQLVDDWLVFVRLIENSPQKNLDLKLIRNDQIVDIQLIPDLIILPEGDTVGRAGIMVEPPQYPPELLFIEKKSFLSALITSSLTNIKMAWLILQSIWKMFTGALSWENVGGPITIVQELGSSAQHGFLSFLSLLSYLSISLAVLNLLPIPILDGGHLLFFAYEAIKGKPLSAKWKSRLFYFGAGLLLALMLFATFNDISKL